MAAFARFDTWYQWIMMSGGLYMDTYTWVHYTGCTKMQNYMPISLLQVLYKIFAGLIKNRLIETYDPWIQQS